MSSSPHFGGTPQTSVPAATSAKIYENGLRVMTSQVSGIDIVAYDQEGRVLLLAEAKSRGGTSESWAARLRKNMLSHGILPWAKYFLIATPERMYFWKQGHPN